MNEERKFWLVLAGGLLLALAAALGTWQALRQIDSAGIIGSDRASSGRKKVFQQTFVEGLRVTRHGFRGVDFLQCGKCRLEKRKQGFITFGGFNVLVLEDLSIVLPPDGVTVDDSNVSAGDSDTFARASAGDSNESAGVSAKHGNRKAKLKSSRNGILDIVRYFGVDDGFLANRGLPARFSGLRIERFKVGRLVGDAEVRPLFKASMAEAVRGGLKLSHCEVALEDGRMESVGKAMLTRKGGKLRLSWPGGDMDL